MNVPNESVPYPVVPAGEFEWLPSYIKEQMDAANLNQQPVEQPQPMGQVQLAPQPIRQSRSRGVLLGTPIPERHVPFGGLIKPFNVSYGAIPKEIYDLERYASERAVGPFASPRDYKFWMDKYEKALDAWEIKRELEMLEGFKEMERNSVLP